MAGVDSALVRMDRMSSHTNDCQTPIQMTATAPIQMTATAPIQLKQQKVEEERDNSALELRVAAVEGGVEGGTARHPTPQQSRATACPIATALRLA